MESGGGTSGGGGDVGACSGGHLCHVCGYKFASAHPSAKQRRAHRKNCGGKPSPSAATTPAVVDEDEGGSELRGGKLLLGSNGEGEGERCGEERSGAGASDCGGRFPGSAQDVGNAVTDEGNAEHSSPNGSGVQVIINRSTEDIPSEFAPKANESEIQTEVAMQSSESASCLEDSHPSEPAISFEQHLDVSASASDCPLEPEDGASFNPQLSADGINKLNVTSLASNAAAGEIPTQTNTIVGSPGDVAVTKVDCTTTAIHKDQTSDEANGSAINLFYQEKLQTEISGGQNATTMEADPSVHNFSVVYKEEMPSEDTESKEQNRVILINSIEQVCTIKEPVDLFGNEESCTEKHVSADGTNGDHLFELGSSDGQLEIADALKSRQESDYMAVAAEHSISKQEGQPCPDRDEVIQAIPSATGPAVGAEILSAGSSANLTKKDCSSEVTTGDVTQDNARHTGGITFMPHEVYSAELSLYPTSHQINTVGSKDNVVETRHPTSHQINTVGSKDNVVETRHNQNITSDLSSHEMNVVQGIDVETKQCMEDISADTASHETNAVCSTGDFGEQWQSEGIIAEASSHKISIVQGANDTEENEQIEEVIQKPASEKIDVMSSGDIDGENKQSEFYVETAYESNMACIIEHVEENKKPNEGITADPTCEISTVNFPGNIELKKQNEKTTNDPIACEISIANITDKVEEQKQNEESTTDSTRSINVIPSPDDEDKKLSEDMTEGPSFQDVVMASTNDVTEKNEDNMSGPTYCKVDAVSIGGTVQEKMQNEEITVGPTSHWINVVHTVDDVEEKKNNERTSDTISGKIDAEGNIDDVEYKRQNEEITMDSTSHENSIPQGTDNAGEKKQDEEAVADPASDKLTAAQSTDDTEEKKQKEEAATHEIDTTHNTKEDQSEEITDKEMTVNSDKNHVSLKALLSEKGGETKEKKASTKDRVLSFRRRSSKDNASPTKPGAGQQDWNSPARLPVEKSPKGKKQQWMPFICCPSIK